ncbi:MAG: phenylalanine--tRNA ligase subunit alpha [Anaerolineaceae bacterium 4572_78]|nr:MAG: phenylalanine--tRNA ligase subunit alpha [Anaerolineaceae bacterium 4572_78]
MRQELETLGQTAQTTLIEITDSEMLNKWHVKYIGRKGAITTMLRRVGELSKEERPAFGKRANELKKELEHAYQSREYEIKASEMKQAFAVGSIDVTLPGRPIERGRLHPSTQTLRLIYQIWADMGFQIYRSREVELDEYNFQMLNMPPHHPARDMQDTFYTTKENVLLRTHTSPGQIRAMHEYHPEPIRIILPGMVFRYEQITPSKEIQFHQVEGLAVGRNITMTDLKGTLNSFAQRIFGKGRPTRFRASHFPFTEPSAEMDVQCILCHGKGCRVCKHTGWMEILGCGMVHPTVLRYGGYDPSEFTGFAFGMGPERIVMLRHGIEDIRYFWGNDLKNL